MRFVQRAARPVVLQAARSRCGGDRAAPHGKNHFAAAALPRATYVLLEDPDIQARARSDPRSLLEELKTPVLFDEIQNVPELLPYVRTRADKNPRKMGQWLFTGSQEAPLMRGVSESMAGRAAILQLLAFSMGETDRVSLLHGGYLEAAGAARRTPNVSGSYSNVSGARRPRDHQCTRSGDLPALPRATGQPSRTSLK